MNIVRAASLLASAFVALASVSFGSWAQDGPLTVGPNINMVSGTDWPEGDPFLRQQNEPSLAFSSRNKLHLLAGANDYRTVDVPGDFEAGATGDSWLSYFWSTNGGGTWKSTLIPCYPQDTTSDCSNNPLKGYAAGADPVVRAGANGMFYYAGIAFERTENPGSLIFVSRFIDLNNDEGGDPIRYIDTVQVDIDTTGDRFLDKVWVAVDVPRSGAATKVFTVNQRSGPPVEQKVSCGNIYVAYAALTGDGATLRSEIMMAVSTDCGDSWTKQPISEPDTLNQGANIAISPMDGDVHVGWRRFDTVEAFLGTPAVSCAKPIRDWRRRRKSRVAVDWPLDNVDVGDERLTREQALDLLGQPGLLPSIRLAQFLVAAKLNLLSGGGQATDTFDPAEWTRTLSGLIDETDDFFRDKPLRIRDAGFFSNPRTLFFPSGLNFRERRAARDLRIAIRDIYLGSEDCVVTAGTDPITTGATNAMVATSSTDGASWTPPVTVAEIRTFDQGGTNFSFRTTAYPTLAVDKAGLVYMAYAARGFATVRPDQVEGDARIVLSVSGDGGANWQAPYAIDDDPEKPGHQFKPSLLFAGGRLVVVFYDLRADVSGLFERFVYDVPEPDRLRHTLDVRAATASVLAGPMMPQFTLYDLSDRRDSRQASRYAFVATGNGVPVDTVQLQYMVPNLPTHAGGTQPFIGDYVDVSTKTILKEGDGWRFATEPGDVDVYQAVWTDNRDISPPPDGDWTKYQPLNLDNGGGGNVSVFDGSPIPACEPGVTSQFTGTRNQNIYTAALSEGLIVAAPGSNRPLGTAEGSTELLERAYVVFVQNVTAFERSFRLTVSPPVSGSASFEQFADKSSVDVTVPPFSSTVETVYASSPDPNALVAVLVQELDGLGAPLPGGLFSTVLLNADPTAPAPSDASLLVAETHNPTVLNPTVLNPTVLNPTVLNPTVLNPTVFNPTVLNPTVFNPTVLNPTVFNPTVLNPTVFNPTVLNPTVFNPTVLNPTVLNPTVFNPTVFNPTILNPTVLNPTVFNPTVLNPTVLNPTVLNSAISDPAQQSAEVTFAVQNDGNATSSFDINLASSQGVDDGFSYQVLVYRLNKTPVADGCSLEEEAQQELIANVVDPGNLLDPSGGDGTTSFYIEPGDEVFVTVRVLPDTSQPNPGDPSTLDDTNLDLAIAVVPQAVDSEVAEMGETEPTGTSTFTAPVPPVEIDTQEIPDGDVDQPYSVALEASGGIGTLSWSLAMGGELLPGLSLSADGVINGTPTEPGSLVAPVRVTDGIQVAEAMFAATIEPPPLFITTASLPDGEVDEAYPVTALQSSGGFGEISWTLLSGSLPPGIVLAPDGTLSGTPTADGSFEFIVEASDDFQSVDQSLIIGVASNDVIGGTGGSPFSLACPAGTVGIGLRGRAGQDIDRIELICAEITGVEGGFPELGNEVSAGSVGNLGGADFGDALVCPPSTVLKGLRANERSLGGGNVVIDQLGATCIDSGGGLVSLGLVGANDVGGPVQAVDCPLDNFVTGVAGRSGALLDQVGVSCAPVGGEFIAAEIPPKFYGVAVANPGFLSRSGRVLEFSQSPREGIAFDFAETQGDAFNRPFTWDVVAGELVLTYNSLPGVVTFDSLANSTATPEQVAFIQSLPTFNGQLQARRTLTRTVYTLVAETEPLRVDREDTQIVEYDPIPVPVSSEYPDGFLQLPPRFEAFRDPGTLRDAVTAPVIPLSADCSSEPCVPGSWAGYARYQPGAEWITGEILPTSHYGEVLSFSVGTQQTVSGDISNLSASWAANGGSLEITYDDGWTQTVTAVGVNGLEYGMFSEYRNVNSGERYASYDIWVKRDENFVNNVFSDAYLNNATDSYWNSEINIWIPGNINPDGSRPLTPRFGWKKDDSGDPNTGFNRNAFFSGPNNEVLTLFLRPTEWEIEQPSRRVKIDRFLDTEFESFDRFWYPIASTTVGGDRQLYVIEFERREDGLLFPARLNIQRELFDNRSEYADIQVQEPVIVGDGIITNVSPQPAAAGFGQLLVVTGTNLPTGPNAQVFINQFGVTYQGFSFGNNTSTNHLIRLVLSGAPSQPGPGPATLQLSEAGANAPRTPEFPIQIEVIPTAPELLDARPTLFSTPVSTFPIDGEVSLRTFNTDTSGARATFVGSGVNETVLSLVTSSSGVTDGLLQSFSVPSGIALGAAIDVSVTTTVNGETSPPSNSLTLYACEPGNITIDGSNVVRSTLGIGVAGSDVVYVRYDLAAATFGADLPATSLSVSGTASITLVSGGAAGDTSVIFEVLAGPNGLPDPPALTFSPGSLTLLGEPGDVLVFGQTFETLTDAINDSTPLYVTGPACQ